MTDNDILKHIAPGERGLRSPHEAVHALRFINEYGCHLIPSHGLLHSAADREAAINTPQDLARYLRRFAPWNFLVRCEQGDPFRCIKAPDAENFRALEEIAGEKIESVTVASDAGETFTIFKASARTPSLSPAQIAHTRCRVSPVFPLPGALCRKTNSPYRFARFLGEGDLPFAPISSRLLSVLPKKSAEMFAPPVSVGRYGVADYSERNPLTPEELQKSREQQRARRANAKAAAHRWNRAR